MKHKRMRLRLQSTVLKCTYDTRPKDYLNLRTWWLHELTQLRAKHRVHGLDIRIPTKTIQRELARLRREYC